VPEPAADPAAAADGRRVLFVIPEGRPPSGGDLYNRFLLKALKGAGFRFDVTRLGRLREELSRTGTELWVDSLYIAALEGSDPFRPDDRVFFVVHSLPSADPGISPARAETLREIEDRLFARAAGFLVTGPMTHRVLEKRGFGGVPILTVPPAPCVLPAGPPVAPPVFTGFIVSSLIRGKGVAAFVEALGREVLESDLFTVRIAGRTDIEPETAAACLGMIESHPLLRRTVRHLGFIPYEDLGGEYGRSSVLISPSMSESFGMAFHEARAFGLPILAVRAPYSEPFIDDGRNGLLFESPAELAGGVLDLVRDPERVRELAAGAALSRPSASYTWDDAARSFLKQRQVLL